MTDRERELLVQYLLQRARSYVAEAGTRDAGHYMRGYCDGNAAGLYEAARELAVFPLSPKDGEGLPPFAEWARLL